jgi:hypothetical protein
VIGELPADGLRQRLECPERMPVARDQRACAVFDIRDHPESVEFI